ncbi:MAG: DNA alkylation repair protein [Acidobacteria bacterium]|nr:DNA alkylation repair protein [Acidobacteriota bacterium]
MPDTPKRKGAVRISEIPTAILKQLNTGAIESVNLTEWLAVDQRALLMNVLPALNLAEAVAPAFAQVSALKKRTQMQCLPVIAAVLLETLKPQKNRNKLLAALIAHPSDTVRCWAAYVIGLDDTLSLEEKLMQLRPIATDQNSGVREIAWMAVRTDLEAQLAHAVTLLTEWTKEQDANLRRFASEATRPRGVWCKHIETLKQNPEIAYPILAPLKSDESKYVRDSVANWLNDASKSQPDWVREVCALWTEESPTQETQAIIKRALRTIGSEK